MARIVTVKQPGSILNKVLYCHTLFVERYYSGGQDRYSFYFIKRTN